MLQTYLIIISHPSLRPIQILLQTRLRPTTICFPIKRTLPCWTTLTPDDVTNVLKTLDNNKAHGPDGIPARLLIETASQISPSLCELFNKSLRTGMVPFDWKLANVVPVYKKDDQEFVENYRPISLLSLISKVLERCVFNNIKDHIYSQINACQHGFVPGKKLCVSTYRSF